MRRPAQVETAQALVEHALGSAGGCVRGCIIGEAVGRDLDGRVRLADGVRNDSVADVVVVAGGIREGPVVGAVGAGGGVRRVGQVEAAQGPVRAHARGRARRRVRDGVIGEVVGRDHNRRVRLADDERLGGRRAERVVVRVASKGDRLGVIATVRWSGRARVNRAVKLRSCVAHRGG